MICAYPLIGRFIIFKQAEEKGRLKKMKEIIYMYHQLHMFM